MPGFLDDRGGGTLRLTNRGRGLENATNSENIFRDVRVASGRRGGTTGSRYGGKRWAKAKADTESGKSSRSFDYRSKTDCIIRMTRPMWDWSVAAASDRSSPRSTWVCRISPRIS